MRVDRHAGIPPSGLTAKRVNRQWRLNPPIGNNGDGGRAPSDPSNLLQNVARPIRKLPGGEFPATKVAEIRQGRFGSRHFRNLEKTRSDRIRKNRFSASPLIRFTSSASSRGSSGGSDRPHGLAGSRARSPARRIPAWDVG